MVTNMGYEYMVNNNGIYMLVKIYIHGWAPFASKDFPFSRKCRSLTLTFSIEKKKTSFMT